MSVHFTIPGAEGMDMQSIPSIPGYIPGYGTSAKPNGCSHTVLIMLSTRVLSVVSERTVP